MDAIHAPPGFNDCLPCRQANVYFQTLTLSSYDRVAFGHNHPRNVGTLLIFCLLAQSNAPLHIPSLL
jgi:hypothetical protein